MSGYQASGADWVIVITKPMAEEVAERSLRQAGYRVYLPRYRKLLRPHGSDRRGVPSMRPLFAGYLFVQDWRGWPDKGRAKITGVERLLMRQGERPYLLTEGDVEITRSKEHTGRFDDCAPPSGKRQNRDDLAIGAEVEFDFLSLRHRAAIEGLTATGKAIVTAIFFNREVRTEVDADELELAAS